MGILKNESKDIYIAGDFFVSEFDKTNVGQIIKRRIKQDLFLLNLEGVPNIHKERGTKKMSLALNSKVLDIFKSKNIFGSIVNNHTSDFGKRSFYNLEKILGSKALISLANEEDPRKRIGKLNFIILADEREECRCRTYNFLRFDRSVIKKNRRFIAGSVIIIHGGIEYRSHPTPYQRELARLLVDLNAHSVIFHHSHVKGVHEWYLGRLIHYGLGNFYFSELNGLHGLLALDGCVLKLSLDTDEFQVSEVMYKRDCSTNELYLSLDFSPLSNVAVLPPPDEYRAWYKANFSLDASFRPRQLFNSEWLIRGQFYLWYFCATSLTRIGLSKKIKTLLRLMSRK